MHHITKHCFKLQIHNFVNNILITEFAERYENHFYQTIPERSAGGEGIATICSITELSNHYKQ